MSINAESILERKEALVGDLESTKIKQQEIEKAKLENVALQNALAGAIQQCDDLKDDAFIPSVTFPPKCN